MVDVDHFGRNFLTLCYNRLYLLAKIEENLRICQFSKLSWMRLYRDCLLKSWAASAYLKKGKNDYWLQAKQQQWKHSTPLCCASFNSAELLWRDS